jgi:hypothetical protein
MAYAEFVVKAEWEFDSGKFAPRDAITEAIIEEIMDPGSISAEDGEYSITTWDVEEQPVVEPLSMKKLVEKLMPACAVLGITDKAKVEQFITLYRASGGSIW